MLRWHFLATLITTLCVASNAKILPESSLINERYNQEHHVNRADVDSEVFEDSLNTEDAKNSEGPSLMNKDARNGGNNSRDMANDVRDNDETQQTLKDNKWAIVTRKYTKKLRKTNFKNFKVMKNHIMEKFELGKEWQQKILKAIPDGQLTIKPFAKRLSLKSSTGNELTILSGDATLQRSSPQRNPPRTNVTCLVAEEYDCTITVTREVFVSCWIPPRYQCVQYRQEPKTLRCWRQVPKCCNGYRLGVSGYCERPRPASPPPASPKNGCGGHLTSREGVITSPNYPQFYPNEQNCKWTISAPSGYKVALKIINLAIEEPVGACDLAKWQCFKFCEFDRLKITDVTTGDVKTLCGYRQPTAHYESSGKSVEIAFESDVSSGGKGFKIVYAIASEHEMSTYHPECTGGQKWQICHQRCARTCRRHHNGTSMMCIESGNRFVPVPLSQRNEISCLPGCSCPPDRPIWYQGKCIKPESCPGNFFQCGKPAVQSKLKVVGGRVAGKYAWPWMVQIESDSIFHICGATLICSNWVLTAAHCFLNLDRTKLDLNPRRYLVNVGKYWKNEQQDQRIVQTYEPEKIIVHPGYRVNTDTKVDVNDIAVIRLSRAVDVTDYVRPVCLPHPTLQSVTSETSQYAKYQQPTTGTSCKVLGWGTTKGIGPTAEKLKEASISIQPGSACVYPSYDWKLMICAGGHENEDTCRGDSGGPLLCQRRGTWILDGVTSFGDACGEAGVAGGYTRVSSYIGWIRSYTGYQCEA